MSKKLILAAIAATFALSTMQAPAFAKGGHGHHSKSTFNANGGNGGNNNSGNKSGNGGNGGTIKNAGKTWLPRPKGRGSTHQGQIEQGISPPPTTENARSVT